MQQLNIYITEKLKLNKSSKAEDEDFDKMNKDAFEQIKTYFNNWDDITYEIRYNKIFENYVMLLKFKAYPQFLKETKEQNKFLDFLESTTSTITGEVLVNDGMKDVYFCDDKWISIILGWFRK